MAKTQYYGTGRRKSSVARVRLIPGSGNITVNKKTLDEYLPEEIVKREVKRPFEIAGCEGKFDVIVNCSRRRIYRTGRSYPSRYLKSSAAKQTMKYRPVLKSSRIPYT